MGTNRSLAASVLVLSALVVLAAELARGSDEVGAPRRAQTLLSRQDLEVAGRELYLTHCASCHGPDGEGTPNGPSLVGVGAAAADFQLTTGRMPLAEQPGRQTQRKPPTFPPDQVEALVAYVASLGDGPAIPEVDLDASLLPRGQRLYIENCAPCHGATAAGGALGGGALAPPLDQATAVQVAEAMLTGPGQMPAFEFPKPDLDATATYVDFLQHAPQPGGFSIGGVGPVPEGFVAWVLGMGLLLLIVYMVGREWDRRAEASAAGTGGAGPRAGQGRDQ